MSHDNLREYGDLPNLSQDSRALMDILQRQGTNLVIDCLAEHVGLVANKFNFDASDRTTIRKTLTLELDEAMSERL